MRKQLSILNKQSAFLLAKYTQMRKQLSILNKQSAFLLAKYTEMRKQLGILNKQSAFLLIQIGLRFFANAVTSEAVVHA